MSVEILARGAWASSDLQRGIQPLVGERWGKDSGCQAEMIGGLLGYKRLNNTVYHVRHICRIREVVSTRMLNQHPQSAQPAGAPPMARQRRGRGEVGVTVTVLGDQALIGQSILRRFTLTLDHGKQVILEP
jgi:hypothetical protein